MANVAASESIKSVASHIQSVIDQAWARCIVRDDDGKANLDESRRAFGLALRGHLRESGQLVSIGRGPSESKEDLVNIAKAAYAAFHAHQKNGKCKLPEVEYATLAQLDVPFVEYERARRTIHKVLTNPEGKLLLTAGARKFDGTTVTAKSNGAPEAFLSWNAMHAMRAHKASPAAAATGPTHAAIPAQPPKVAAAPTKTQPSAKR